MRQPRRGRKPGKSWRSFQKAFHRSEAQGPSWRMGFILLGLLLAASVVCVSLLYAAKANPRSPRVVLSSYPPLNKELGKSFSSFTNEALPHFEKVVAGKYIEERNPYRLLYTVDPALQARVNEVFQSHRPPFSAFVAIEPKTGKILALVEHTRENPEYAGIWKRATYPAASVFKLVTAAGALEKGLLNYDSFLSFRGNPYRLAPQKLGKNSKRDRQTSFDEALGKSNNVVFGRVASKLVGPQTLRQYSEAFHFNHPIPFDFSLEVSRAFIPEGPYELARCGAGFGEVTLSPLHAAMIASSIGNHGVMMKPYLIEEISNGDGEKLYQAKAEVLAQPITAKTAQDLGRMMLRTVEDGTASRVFQRYGKNLLEKMSICGKTGSLSGENPPGLYDWFVGFAPAEDPQIAFAAMIINHKPWRIKGTFVAQEALKTFFREQIK